MEGVKKRLSQARDLITQINQKNQELKAKAAQVKYSTSNKTKTNRDTTGWNQGASFNPRTASDPLEAKFQQLEIDEELKKMKRNL
jgi:hypothetical protein